MLVSRTRWPQPGHASPSDASVLASSHRLDREPPGRRRIRPVPARFDPWCWLRANVTPERRRDTAVWDGCISVCFRIDGGEPTSALSDSRQRQACPDRLLHRRIKLGYTVGCHRGRCCAHPREVVSTDRCVQEHPVAVGCAAQSVQDSAAQPSICRRERGRPFARSPPAPAGSGQRCRRAGACRHGRKPAPRARGAVIATWHAWLAERRPDVHHRMRPDPRPVGWNGRIGDSLQLRRAYLPRGARDDPAEDSPDVDVDGPDTNTERECRDRARGVRPDSRQGKQRLDRRRHPTVVLRDDDPCRPPQRDGTSVVSETRPFPQDISRRGGRQRIHRWESHQEPFPVVSRARGLGLLGHRLRHEDRVWIGRAPKGQRSATLGVPREDRLARRNGDTSLGRHDPEDSGAG